MAEKTEKIWCFILGERLTECTIEEALAQDLPSVFLSTSKYAAEVLEKVGMKNEGDLSLKEVGFSKVETQQECMAGTFYIPKLVDILGTRFQILFYIDQRHVVIIDDDDFSKRMINRIRYKKAYQGDTKERFLYNFISEFMSRDLALLVQYEKRLMQLEEDVTKEKTSNFQSTILTIRNELMTLREYYDEIADMARELEENENRYFAKKQLKYFGTISARADRLMARTIRLLERAQQIADTYQTNMDARQNNNMKFLTIISTIFMPLTLITSWYGMNFKNMPELEKGYPFVILLSLVVICGCIFIFKKKHIL